MYDFSEFGLTLPDILLPSNVDLKTWCSVACDQFTQDEEYWSKAEKIAEGKPSTLHLMLPEIYLEKPDRSDREKKVTDTMKNYLSSGVFSPSEREFIYVERKTSFGRMRRGLIAAVDLDSYDWQKGSSSLVRATEATIASRLPPRMKIRREALLEMPHIMLLLDDKHDRLMSSSSEAKRETPIYDGDLMLSGGHITGWAIKDSEDLDRISSSLGEIKKENTDKNGDCLLFAVGDGNHSLAAAKEVWEEEKKRGCKDSLLRYALSEIVSIYDPGLTFEPIHRFLFDLDPRKLIDFMKVSLKGSLKEEESDVSLAHSIKSSSSSIGFAFLEEGKRKFFRLDFEDKGLAVSVVQPSLDSFIASSSGCKIDYIHGEEDVLRLSEKENTVSILMPPIAKESFFSTIRSSGSLPRKSFSMGEASEKRYYLECRSIR